MSDRIYENDHTGGPLVYDPLAGHDMDGFSCMCLRCSRAMQDIVEFDLACRPYVTPQVGVDYLRITRDMIGGMLCH